MTSRPPTSGRTPTGVESPARGLVPSSPRRWPPPRTGSGRVPGAAAPPRPARRRRSPRSGARPRPSRPRRSGTGPREACPRGSVTVVGSRPGASAGPVAVAVTSTWVIFPRRRVHHHARLDGGLRSAPAAGAPGIARSGLVTGCCSRPCRPGLPGPSPPPGSGRWSGCRASVNSTSAFPSGPGHHRGAKSTVVLNRERIPPPPRRRRLRRAGHSLVGVDDIVDG